MKEEFNFVCTQLGQIREARNLLIHYETRRGKDGIPYLVTNKRIALDKKRLVEKPISATILSEMTADLEKIVGHLIVLLFRSEKASRSEIAQVKNAYAKELAAPWQYKRRQLGSRNRGNGRAGIAAKRQFNQPGSDHFLSRFGRASLPVWGNARVYHMLGGALSRL